MQRDRRRSCFWYTQDRSVATVLISKTRNSKANDTCNRAQLFRPGWVSSALRILAFRFGLYRVTMSRYVTRYAKLRVTMSCYVFYVVSALLNCYSVKFYLDNHFQREDCQEDIHAYVNHFLHLQQNETYIKQPAIK